MAGATRKAYPGGGFRGDQAFVDRSGLLDPGRSVPVEYKKLDFPDLLQRSRHPLSDEPRAFLRWAGSKRYVLNQIVDVLPRQFRTYREPFLGSGALFFLLRPASAALSDSSRWLIDTFRAIRNDADLVIRCLRGMNPQDKALFELVRKRKSRNPFKRAADFIFLNKAGWNGLYRVNSDGTFNVPFGRHQSGFLADFENLRACAQLLSSPGVSLRACDFEQALNDAKDGDLIYFDPPYVRGHTDNGFIDYNEVLFSWSDQVRLARVARDLVGRGAHVVISNANYPDIIGLYPGFRIKMFERPSTLASDVSKRKLVSEILLFWACG